LSTFELEIVWDLELGFWNFAAGILAVGFWNFGFPEEELGGRSESVEGCGIGGSR
jgi:hypothetical protein